jgi:elongation factor G
MGARLRNVALVGPNGTGKTTLLESLLFVTGTIGRKGRVADGTTISDWSPESKARGISTEVSAATFAFNDHLVTILDCPGSAEFCFDTRAALLGADLAVVVIEPVSDRMITAAPLLHYLDEHRIPHLVFINKMDRSEERYRDILSALRVVSARPIVPHQYAIGRGESLVGYIDLVTEEAYAYRRDGRSDRIPLPEDHREREQAARTEMLETLADFDDDLLETLLEEQRPSEEQILRDLRKTLGSDQVVPVFMGVAEAEMGVRRFLETLVAEAPEPDTRAGELGIEPEGSPVVQILKNWHLPHTGKLSLARVWRGTLKDGTTLGGMRVSGLHRMLGNQTQPLQEAEAGTIVALGRLDEARTGTVLTASGEPPPLPAPSLPAPMFALAIRAINRTDEVKLSGAFARLVDEDPSLRVEADPEMHQTVLWGQGEIHLKVALDRLSQKYNVPVEGSSPRTHYRETIRKGTQAHGRHKKQSGGHGKVVGGAVPRQFIPAVEAGAKEFLRKGPLGFPVVDVGVTLFDGQFHSVDSNELSFKMATAQALKEGLTRCAPVLLEPILDVRVNVPTDYTAKALQLVTSKRGQILGYEAKGGWPGWDQIQANIPQGEIHDLILTLRSLTLGTGWFEWTYDHLQEVPERLTASIVENGHAAAAQ